MSFLPGKTPEQALPGTSSFQSLPRRQTPSSVASRSEEAKSTSEDQNSQVQPSRRLPLSQLTVTSTLKTQLQRKLDQPRVTHLLRLAKSRALVSRVAVNSIELGVVEDVEELRPEFEMQLFTDRS
jgi:hypothetical protein